MDKIKYVMFRNVPILFSDAFQHSDFKDIGEYGDEPTSAGFVSFCAKTNKFECYGESLSLDLKSKPKDTHWVNKLFGLEE